MSSFKMGFSKISISLKAFAKILFSVIVFIVYVVLTEGQYTQNFLFWGFMDWAIVRGQGK